LKKITNLTYHLLSWLILLILFLSFSLLFFLESPSSLFKLLERPLKEQGIQYGEIEGSLLSGFILHDVNYQDQVKAKSVALKVDFHQLQKRVLYIDQLILDEGEIEKGFLASLIDTNETTQENNESNISLPFDRVIVNEMILSLKNISYETYHLNKGKLKLKNFETDMKMKYHGSFSLLVDSNVSQLNLKGKIKDNRYEVKAIVEGEQGFINTLSKEYGLTLPLNPKVDLRLKGDLKKVDFSLTTEVLNLNYEYYKLKSRALNLKGYYDLEKEDVKVNLYGDLDANVAKLNLKADAFVNLDDINKSLKFDLHTQLAPKALLLKEELVKKALSEQNITVETFPNMLLIAKGDMQKVDFKTTIDQLKVRQNRMDLGIQDFRLEGKSSPLKGATAVKLVTAFDTSFAKGNLNSSANFNFKDLEKSLDFDLETQLQAKASLVQETLVKEALSEQNITVETFPNMLLIAKGDMQKVDFNTTVDQLKVRQNKINLGIQDFRLEGKSSPLKGETEVRLLTAFDTSFAKGDLSTNANFNFNDLENSLHFDVKSDLEAYDAYLTTLLKEHNVSISGMSPLKLSANGTMKEMTLKAKAETTLIYENIASKVHLETEEIALNLEKEEIDGALRLNAKGKALAFDLKSKFLGNYMNPKKMRSDTTLNIANVNAFGVNLTSFMPMRIDVSSAPEGATVDLKSKKLEAKITSLDYNSIDFFVKSDAIYPDKIMPLSKSLNGKFVKLDLKGDLTLEQQFFKVKGLLESNKKFIVKVDAFSKAEGLKVDFSTQHLTLKAKGDLASKNIDATLKVDSLKALQKEFLALYPFTPVDVDGELKLDAKLRGEKISANLSSKKIALPGLFLEEIAIEGEHEKDLISIHKLNFKTKGVNDSSLNHHFYLNQKAYVNLGEEKKVFIDMHPKILIKANGKEENIKATLQIEELLLGYPEYAKTKFSCDIDYFKEGEKQKIIGGVFLDKLKVFYESKFLDPSQDNDVVILKKKRASKEEDNFLKNTFIDLTIYSSQAQYKTQDIDLEFDMNLKVEKRFGKTLGVLGKIEEIDGRVEQSPKLFSVVNSNIVFQGREEINPLLDLTVEHELPDILITINIHGSAKRPKLTFTSEPPLPKKDILSYLLLGVSTAGLQEGKGSLGREAQLFIMNQAARDLAYEVELDRVFVKDDGTGEGYAVQVGKKINEESMFIIERSTEGNSFILEYDVNKNIKVEVGHHQKTVPSQSIDIYFRKKFK